MILAAKSPPTAKISKNSSAECKGAPKGQQALSPGQRPGFLIERHNVAMKGQKLKCQIFIIKFVVAGKYHLCSFWETPCVVSLHAEFESVGTEGK